MHRPQLEVEIEVGEIGRVEGSVEEEEDGAANAGDAMPCHAGLGSIE